MKIELPLHAQLTAQESTRKSPWLMWGIGTAFGFYQFLLQSSAAVIAPKLGAEFGMTNFGIGLFASIYFYTYLTLQLPAGYLLDKYGARRLLLISLPATTLACLLLAIAPNAEIAAFARFLTGFTAAPGVISGFYLASNWFSSKQYVLVMGLTELICMMGGGIGQKLVAHSAELWGWRGSMILCGMMGLAIWLAAWAWLQNAPDEESHLQSVETPSAHPIRPESVAKQILGNQTVVAAGIFAAFAAALIGSFAGMWGIPFLESQYQFSSSQATTSTGLIFLGAGLGCIGSGIISNRLGRRKPIMAISALLTCGLISLLIFGQLKNLPMIMALMFAIGFSCGGYMLSFSIAKEVLPQSCRGAAIGFINMMTMVVGAMAFQPLIGYLLNNHSYQFALSIIPIALLLAVFALLFVKETHCRSVQQQVASSKGRVRSKPAHNKNSFWTKRKQPQQESIGR